MKPIILYREDSDLKDFPQEQAAMARNFEITPRRTVEELHNSLVIGRYSVLPFYKELCDDLAVVGSQLVNSLKQHLYIADVMRWAAHELEGLTPRTWGDHEMHLLPEGTKFVLKGQTNSCKFNWNTHMFAEDRRAAVVVFLLLKQDLLLAHQNIYIREYIPLKTHFISLHGLPITEEFRFFVYCGRILSGGYYWSNFTDEFGGKPPSPDKVPRAFLNEVIARIGYRATFYALDVAQTADDDWIVIEVNDAQMSGLSDNDPDVLYHNLRETMNSVWNNWEDQP